MDVSGTYQPMAGNPGLIRLMPLNFETENFDADGNGTLDGITVTPTHKAVQSGDWNDPDTWGGSVPSEGAIVHIPMGLEVVGSGNISDSNSLFLVRVDGALTLKAENGADTKMIVDTIFTSGHGSFSIDADEPTDGTVDVAFTPFDIEAYKSSETSNWTAETASYYTDGNDVHLFGDTATSLTDGAGVLGRFGWDPEQLSLGLVVHGQASIQGQEKIHHIEHIGVASGQSTFLIDAKTLSELNWAAGDRLLFGATKLPEITTDGLITSNNDIQTLRSQDEVAEILNLVETGTGAVEITLAHPLAYDHLPPQFTTDDAPDVVLNIANLTRNVSLRSGAATQDANGEISTANSIQSSIPIAKDETETIENPLGFGHLSGGTHYVTERAHIMMMHTDDVEVENVAIRGIGRTDKTATLDHLVPKFSIDNDSRARDIVQNLNGLSEAQDPNAISNMIGRYALHLHQAGTAAGDGDLGAMIHGNVVESSVGWGFAQHGSEAILTNNISYDVIGSGFVAETGDETGVWYNNVSFLNRGFATFANDPQANGESNDFGKNGSGFWTEGRGLAIIDNTAISSRAGFVNQPFGVKNIPLETAALTDYQTFFDAINSKFGLTGANALSVSADELDGQLGSLGHGSDTVIQNGFVPIRYFEGNTVLASKTGIVIITSNEHATRKLNDAWSVMSDFIAAEVDTGVFLQYSSKYIFEGFNILGSESGSTAALRLSTSSTDVTSIGWAVEGFDDQIVDQSLRFGTRHTSFADHWNPVANSVNARDGNYLINGYGPLESMWEGFSGPLDPWQNLYDVTFVDFKVKRDWHGPAHDLSEDEINTAFRFSEILDYVSDDYGKDHTAHNRFYDQAPDDQEIGIELIRTSTELGLVAEWREDYLNRLHYGKNFFDDETEQFELPYFYFNDVYSERGLSVIKQAPANSGIVQDDVWSGVLVEFDKTDSLGSKRYAYQVEKIVDENGDQVMDADRANTPLFREHVTTNERLVFTRDQINATLLTTGYFTIAGMATTNAAGVSEMMKFVVIESPFSDRLTGEITAKKFVLALDEKWGSDTELDWSAITDLGELDRDDDSMVISDQYAHIRNGQPVLNSAGDVILVDVPEPSFPNGIISGTEGDDVINLNYVDVGGDMQTTGADLIEAGAGNDVIVGDRGRDIIYAGEGNDTATAGRQTTSIYGGDGDDVIAARLWKNSAHQFNGGDGSDTFDLFGMVAGRTTNTTIQDFELGSDSLKIYDQVIDFSDLPTDWKVSVNGQDFSFEIVPGHTVHLLNTDLPIANGSVEGSDGNDTINTSWTDLAGETVTDNADTVFGNAGDDIINSGKGPDLVFGGAGDDQIFGNRGNNELYGGEGDDLLNTGKNRSTLSGGDGDDILEATTNTNVRHVLTGGMGHDIFDIEAANSTKYATITINDFLYGSDTIKVDGIAIDFTSATPQFYMEQEVLGFGENGHTIYENDAHVWFGQGATAAEKGDDKIVIKNFLLPEHSPAGFNFVEGTQWADSIKSGKYTDRNGDGIDADSGTIDIIRAGGGNDNVSASNKGQTTIYGGDGADSLLGGSSGTVIYGEDGDDLLGSTKKANLFGGDGDDVFRIDISKTNNSNMTGGSGQDIFRLLNFDSEKPDSTSATINDFTLAEDSLVVQGAVWGQTGTSAQFSTSTDGDTLILQYNAFVQVKLIGLSSLVSDGIVQGTDADNTITLGFADLGGDAVTTNADVIYGLGGNDTINGSNGNDQIYGGDGDDYIDGDRKYNELYGDAGNDTIVSGKHTSELFGGEGSDHLILEMSHGGDHTLSGGSGADHFDFRSAASKVSTMEIVDFERGLDQVTILGQSVDFSDPSSWNASWSISEGSGGELIFELNDQNNILFSGESYSEYL